MKYYELYKQIKNNIISGNYPAKSKLLSKRVMADKFGCSIITVEKAYNMLADEGYISSKERSGFFVEKLDIIKSDNKFNSLANIKLLDEELAQTSPTFESSVWLKTVRKVLSEYPNEIFVKAPAMGCSILRNAIARYLLRYRGMHADARRIIIGSGAEQLYENVVKILGRDKIFAIENPCYEKINSVYSSEGVQVIQLKMGKEGILSSELNSKKFDVLHVTPFNSFPSSITATAKKRYEYLAVAKNNNCYIVEDDFASEFFQPGHPIECLYSLDSEQRVIYINTFSKSLSSSMRIGYMILPEILIEKYNEFLGKFSCSVPVLEQYVLAEFINSGNFERHLNTVRRKLVKKNK